MEGEDVDLDFKLFGTGLTEGLSLGAGLFEEEDDGKGSGGGSRTVPTTPYGAGKTFQYYAPLATSPEETIDFAGFRKALEQKVSMRANSIGSAASTHHPCQLAVPFITCSINGSSVMQLTLPHTEFQSTAATSYLKPFSIANPRRSEEGHHYIQIIVVLPCIFISSKLSWSCTLKLSNGKCDETIDLGRISKENSDVCISRLMAFEPEVAVLSATHDEVVGKKQIDPEVEAFIDEIKEVFYSPTVNPRGGSLQLSTVAEHVKETCPASYHKLVDIAYDGNFQDMILAHPDTFLVFQFSDKEIESRGLDAGSAREVRVALTLHEKQGCKAVNTQKESSQRETEKQLILKLEEILHERDYDQRELLDIVAKDTKLLFFLSPSFSTLMRFLSKHRDTFAWTTHPDKPTSIGLVGMLKTETKPLKEKQFKEEKVEEVREQPSVNKKKKKKKKAKQDHREDVMEGVPKLPPPATSPTSVSSASLNSPQGIYMAPELDLRKGKVLSSGGSNGGSGATSPQPPQQLSPSQVRTPTSPELIIPQHIHKVAQQSGNGLVGQKMGLQMPQGVMPQQIAYHPQLQQQQIVLTSAYPQAHYQQAYPQQQSAAYPVHYDMGSGTAIAYPYQMQSLPQAAHAQIQSYVMAPTQPILAQHQFATMQQIPTGILHGMAGGLR
eukprot:TRINITY_DN7205_c0_g2_i1.p1 TRINITY_DN7205_c0_g2~~TRINITY_DN7205_c0_g2_i1.p1  ORF type:complete len:666 (+),score=160.43 TRINITY_DN7205_c0_g2_i1:212-2209(+)